MLDIGCGWGQIDLLVQQGRPDVAISIADAYPECLEKTPITPTAAYLLDEEQFDVGRIGERFDPIVMSHVIEHLLRPVGGLQAVLKLLNAP